MNVLAGKLLLHVGEIHAPDARLVQNERRMHDLVAVVCERAGETDVRWRMNEHLVATRAKHSERTGDAAEHTIFVADRFRRQILHTIARLLPANDRVIIRIARQKIAKRRMRNAARDRLSDRRHRWEIHIRHPHRDRIKAFFRRARKTLQPQRIHRHRILAAPLHDRCKIVSHRSSSSDLIPA